MPWVLFFNMRKWFILIYLSTSAGLFRVPTPKRRRRVSGRTPCDLAEAGGHRQVMGLLSPASWQPFWSHDEDQPWWITYLILLISLAHDVIKHSGYYGSWTINRYEKTLPIKSIWKFVLSFINGPPNTRIKPSNMGIYIAVELNFIATFIQPFNNSLSCRCLLLYVRWSRHGMFSHKGEWSSRHW